MSTYTYTSQLVVMECCSCHMDFAVPPDFDRRRLADHRSFYCPAGHSQSYTGPTEAQRLREQLAAKERVLEAARSLARRESERRQAAERRASAARGQVTKIKNRANKGVCLHCQRSFVNVQKHVAHMHPEQVQS